MKAGKIWGQTELIHANGVLEFHRIKFKAGYKCSEHEHKYKWNGFYVESGRMLITQSDVHKALWFRTFWIVLHILTCCAIIAGNGRVLELW